MKKYLTAALISAIIASCGATQHANAATPTFAQVEQAMSRRDYQSAQQMMDEILRKRPESVKAHTLQAQLIVESGGDREEAKKRLEYARKLKDGDKDAVPPENKVKHSFNIILVVLAIFTILVCLLLGAEYVRVRLRNKKVKDISEPVVEEVDKSNYSTQMTNHIKGN